MSIHQTRLARQPIRHYALLCVNGQEQHGIATLVSGGYVFIDEAEKRISLVSYKSPSLTLLGRCDLVKKAALADERSR